MNDSTGPRLVLAPINTLHVAGLVVTKDIARQLDELDFHAWENFQPLGRINLGAGSGEIEVLGTDRTSGQLVRMRHLVRPLWAPVYDEQHQIGPSAGDGKDDLRAVLTERYSKLPLIILPKG
ncbi:hypothetical protein [Arthrobacter sp. S39]|uniref:hypothetical protein n=1 Tax=Arthrobacter sp. S39 TaxID=2509720 RepID=UPI001037877B|nr:hypothetical protein [Arthrobacter sp. S39]TAP45623.1 hypothetical protein EYS21_02590 [Arthrobacter sp. S39]